MRGLEIVDLRWNQLDGLPDLSGCRDSIKILFLDGNMIEQIREDWRDLKNLEIVSLVNNRISHLKRLVLSDQLKSFGLQKNRIVVPEGSSFPAVVNF